MPNLKHQSKIRSKKHLFKEGHSENLKENEKEQIKGIFDCPQDKVYRIFPFIYM